MNPLFDIVCVLAYVAVFVAAVTIGYHGPSTSWDGREKRNGNSVPDGWRRTRYEREPDIERERRLRG